jgi:curved DNA-binding protein CbpA
MDSAIFPDHYEILEISPNANSETIDRVFRYLAKRYHPDNGETGDLARFTEIVEAHTTLKDPLKRAQYDVQYNSYVSAKWKLAEEAGDPTSFGRDSEIQGKILSILYVRRRQSVRDPGVSNFELEDLLSCPSQHIDFHLWYLREKGWLARLENGLIAITVDGVDRVSVEQNHAYGRLLADKRRERQ